MCVSLQQNVSISSIILLITLTTIFRWSGTFSEILVQFMEILLTAALPEYFSYLANIRFLILRLKTGNILYLKKL